jgi:hypothetical protein
MGRSLSTISERFLPLPVQELHDDSKWQFVINYHNQRPINPGTINRIETNFKMVALGDEGDKFGGI